MQYPVEQYAREIYDRLVLRFPPSADVAVEISGKGVNWKCLARRHQRLSWVHCFEYRHYGDRGPEFLIKFQDSEQEVLAGRTRSMHEVEGAVQAWLDGQSLASLYDHFEFVDRPQRELTRIRNFVTNAFPELQNLAIELRRQRLGSSEIRSLWFRTRERSCHIYFRGELPQASFKWDECEMFRYDVDDLKQFGEVLKRWLSEEAQPSQMRREYPWLTIGEIADYYERGNPIEGEFLHSWNWVEGFYIKSFHFPSRPQVLQFLQKLRLDGYDRKLRAGQSMWTFFVSRSRRHGLRHGQPRVSFEFHDTGMNVGESNGIATHHFESSIDLSNLVKEVLGRLADRGID